jgi:hypothetical protein
MIRLFRHALVWLGLSLARLGGWSLPDVPKPVHEEPAWPNVDEKFAAIVAEVERCHASARGVVKRREAQRCAMQMFPQMPEQRINLMIELALTRPRERA